MMHDHHARFECLSKSEGTADRFLLGRIDKRVHSRVLSTNYPVVALLAYMEDRTLRGHLRAWCRTSFEFRVGLSARPPSQSSLVQWSSLMIERRPYLSR